MKKRQHTWGWEEKRMLDFGWERERNDFVREEERRRRSPVCTDSGLLI